MIGAVAIGRNEGARLIACLDALVGQVEHVVYVDSGSTDGSVAAAEARGAAVVMLDMSVPFTAARARNAGLAALPPQVTLVQFLDGDCILQEAWLGEASAFLAQRDDVAAVCGRRREMEPQASVFNEMCDAEWDTPVGEARACGGDVLIRRTALEAIGGYQSDVIAGEEPEMCVRLRAAGWRIWRIDAEMTLHDAQITRFAQWWQRSRRAGHAFAEGAARHGAPPERHWVAETRRALIWGLVLPVGILCLSAASIWAVFLILLYPLQVIRIWRKGMPMRHAGLLVLGKFAEAQGALQYHLSRLTRRRRTLIEYK